jgi:hypothetical protein
LADLRLAEFVLIHAHFAVRASGDNAWQTEDSASIYPTEEVLELSSTVEREDDEFILLLRAQLTDERLPFELQLTTGARFALTDLPELTADEARSTLIFMAYPYLRETVSSITARSPYQAYLLPPLTRLPRPEVRGEEPPIIETPPPAEDEPGEPPGAPPTEQGPE